MPTRTTWIQIPTQIQIQIGLGNSIKQIMSCHNIDGSSDTSAKNTWNLYILLLARKPVIRAACCFDISTQICHKNRENKNKNMLSKNIIQALHLPFPRFLFSQLLSKKKTEENSDLMNISCCINCPKELLLKGGTLLLLSGLSRQKGEYEFVLSMQLQLKCTNRMTEQIDVILFGFTKLILILMPIAIPIIIPKLWLRWLCLRLSLIYSQCNGLGS